MIAPVIEDIVQLDTVCIVETTLQQRQFEPIIIKVLNVTVKEKFITNIFG
jgi:hypothetical protein